MSNNNMSYSPKKIEKGNIKVSSGGFKGFEGVDIKDYVGSNDFSNEEKTDRTLIEEILDFDSLFLKNDNTNKQANRVAGLSANNYSDKDNIYINKLSDLMTGIQNTLGPEHYEIFSQYIAGMKLSEIIDEEGNILPLTDTTKIMEILTAQGITSPAAEVLYDINKKLEDCNIDLVKLSPDMLASTVTEVVSSDYGYDAIVLKNTDGNYLIVNSCTNADSTNDIYAIAYALAKQIVGDDELLDLVIEQILPAINNSTINNSDYYLDLINNGGTSYLKEVYEAQLQDNVKLIEKYAEIAEQEGNKLELNGYSLGGGLQLTAYSIACRENQDIEKYIQSVSVFNPFISFLEQNPINTGDEKRDFLETMKGLFTGKKYGDNCLVDYIADSDKVRIYSGEEDYVSTFNNCVYDLLDRYTFVKTKDLEYGQVKDVTGIYSIILGDKANHGFKGIELDTFDEFGNIEESGAYISISESMAAATGQESFVFKLFQKFKDLFYVENEEDKYKVDYASIIYQTVNLAHLEEMLKDVPQAVPIIDELKDYLGDNIGNYSYDGIVDALVDGAWDVVGDTIDTEVPNIVRNALPNWLDYLIGGWAGDVVTDIAQAYKDKDAFEEALGDFLKSDENKEYVMSLLNSLKNEDYIKAYGNIKTLISNFEESFEVSYEDVGLESFEILGYELFEYENVISSYVNETIKDEILKILGGLESKINEYAMDAASDYIEDNGGDIRNP